MGDRQLVQGMNCRAGYKFTDVVGFEKWFWVQVDTGSGQGLRWTCFHIWCGMGFATLVGSQVGTGLRQDCRTRWPTRAAPSFGGQNMLGDRGSLCSVSYREAPMAQLSNRWLTQLNPITTKSPISPPPHLSSTQATTHMHICVAVPTSRLAKMLCSPTYGQLATCKKG